MQVHTHFSDGKAIIMTYSGMNRLYYRACNGMQSDSLCEISLCRGQECHAVVLPFWARYVLRALDGKADLIGNYPVAPTRELSHSLLH